MTISNLPASIAGARGLSAEDSALVADLVAVWADKRPGNVLRSGYYDMAQKVKDLGIAVPPRIANLRQAVGWPAKAVDTLCDRSQFDGFVCDDEGVRAALDSVVSKNRLRREYRKACRSELKHSCSFLTVTAGDPARGEHAAHVSAYPATESAALWDDRARRIRAGLVVVDKTYDPDRDPVPTWVDVFTDAAVIRLRSDGGAWSAEYFHHAMGRPLMEPLAFDADLERPFGHSRITREVMDITDDAVRTCVRSEVSAEFFTSPQKYLLGADKSAFDDVTRWDAYIGAIFSVGRDQNDELPQFGQLAQGSMQPHTEHLRNLAARFSGATSVPISSLGVIHDNPSSAEAIYAAKEDLVIKAQDLNADNGDALVNVALMALAVERGTSFAEQEALGLGVTAKFRNPAVPSLVSQADAMCKMVGVLPFLADSDVALEEFGFSEDQIKRLRSDRTRHQANQAFASALALQPARPDPGAPAGEGGGE